MQTCRVILAAAVVLATFQACPAPHSAKIDENIEKLAAFAYDSKNCKKYQRNCGWNTLESFSCQEPKGAVLPVLDLAKVLKPDTTGKDDPTILLLADAICRPGQTDTSRDYSRVRFVRVLKEEAEMLEKKIDDGWIVGDVINWMGKKIDYSNFYVENNVEKKIEDSEKEQAKLMVDFVFNADPNLTPAKTACEIIKKNCSPGDEGKKRSVRLESLECIKPAAPAMIVTHEQLQAVGVQGGTELVNMLCAERISKAPVCYECSKDQLMSELENEMHDTRIALKEINKDGTWKGKALTFANGWLIEYLRPKVDLSRLAKSNPNGR